MSDYANLPDFLRLIAILDENRAIKGTLVEAAEEIERLREVIDDLAIEVARVGLLERSDDPRNLVMNLHVTDEVVDKSEFADLIIDAVMGLCACSGVEVDDAWDGRCTHGAMTLRWTDEPV